MNCAFCSGKAIYQTYCKKHFLINFEKKVRATIKRFDLISKDNKVAIAVSGGKDSMSLLFILHKFGYKVTAIAIDEGISGYREKTLATLREFCKIRQIELKIISFREVFEKTLDQIVHDNRPCTVCGVFRRYLLNKYSKGFDVIATGHNMDDEAQAIIMNLIKNNFTLFHRLGPISGNTKSEKFTKRVKPMYFCLEKEIRIYSYLNNLKTDFVECPYVKDSFRLRIRDILNDLEYNKPHTKKNVIDWYLKNKRTVSGGNKQFVTCKKCGEPSTLEICNACHLMLKINKF